jgi:transcriptional regulator with XRE-family HTH domain
MDSLSDIAGLLRAARALADLSQNELADRAKVSRQMVARIENAGKGIPFEAIEKVRNALEREDVEFFPATATHGPAIALRKGKKRNPPKSA